MSVLGRLWHGLAEERALALTGALGLALGGVCFGAIAVHGVMVEPEGNLYKAGTFDAAVGMFLLTLALIAPVAGMSPRGRSVWRVSLVLLTLFGYGVETIQVFRGLDPRFSRVGTPFDQILGGVFFLSAIAIMICFCALCFRFFFRSTSGEDGPLVLALRYGTAASMLGFGIGIAMSAFGGPGYGGGGNLLPLHAVGFHGLQAVPLVALLGRWGGQEAGAVRSAVHVAGLAWLGLCLGVAAQSFGGRSVLEPSLATGAAFFALLLWGSILARALTWTGREARPVAG